VACTGSKEAKKTVENIVENSPDSSHALAPCGPSTLTNNLCKRNQRLCPIPTVHRGSFGNGKHRATKSKFVMLASNSQKHENSSKETNHQIHQKGEHVRIHLKTFHENSRVANFRRNGDRCSQTVTHQT
jgi:hypothetical protein